MRERATTKVWIKAPKVYNGTNATSIYMYYGNPSAAAVQTGDKTFEFFDDFSNGTGKWTTLQSGVTMATVNDSGNMVGSLSSSGGSGWPGAFGGSESLGDVVIETRLNVKAGSRGGLYFRHINSSDTDNGYYMRIGSNNFGFSTNNTAETGIGSFTMSTNVWYRMKVVLSGTQTSLFMDDQDISIPRTVQNTTGSIGLTAIDSVGGNIYYDHIFVHKYASADPTSSASAEEIGPGPIAYWKLDEAQGDTAKNSTSKTGIDGTLGGGTAQYKPSWKIGSDCISGNCLSFDGSDDYVSTSYIQNSITAYSVSAWVKIPSSQSDVAVVVEDRGDGSGQSITFGVEGSGSCGNICFAGGTGKPFIGVDSNGVFIGILGQNTVNDNKWHHIVGTWSTSSGQAVLPAHFNIYIDGVHEANPTTAAIGSVNSPLTGNSGTQLGRHASWAKYFKGSLDETKIYPYARTTAQIQQDYNAGLAASSAQSGVSAAIGESPKWMTDGLVGYWKMDEASGTTVADASGNANTGTLTSAQETGTSDASGNTVTTLVDTSNASLSTTNDIYNNMILRFTAACGSITDGTERTISDYAYSGSTSTFTVATLAQAPDSCAYEVRHQTGGKFGNGLGFEGYTGSGTTGLTNYVEIANNSSIAPRNQITVSAWVYRESQGGGGEERWIVDKKRNGHSVGDYNLTTQRFSLYVDNLGASGLKALSFTALPTGSWKHLVGTYDGDWMKVFVNGVLVAQSQIGSHTIDSSGQSLGIGGNLNYASGDGYYFFRGLLDDARIYNRALNPDEVKALSEWGPGPLGWWKMDENVSGDAKTLYDSSGNGYNLTTNDGANNTGMDCTKQGKYGNSCLTDGTDDRISVNNTAFSLKFALTWEAWVNFPGTPTMAGGVITGPGCSFRVHQGYADRYQLMCLIGGGYRAPSQTLYFPAGTWHHVAFTYDMYSRNMRVYINGVAVGDTTLTGSELV